MILVSRQGKVRLTKWYNTWPKKTQSRYVREVTAAVLSRPAKQCNFLDWRGYKLIYKRYAMILLHSRSALPTRYDFFFFFLPSLLVHFLLSLYFFSDNNKHSLCRFSLWESPLLTQPFTRFKKHISHGNSGMQAYFLYAAWMPPTMS